MKKISILLSALALGVAFTSCNKNNDPLGGDLNLDEVVLDGFYVYGPATGSDKVLSVNSMAAGFNEATKETRTGMYEKYIWLEAGKEFALIENSAGNKKYYGAELKEVNYGMGTETEPGKNFADNPNMMIQQGKLIIGDNAPKMQVKESGMYHIVLDNNQLNDLGTDGAQIVLQKADWGVRGAMNGWGFTQAEMTKGADGSIVYTLKDQDMPANGEFKFASCHGWKINLDENGTVKAEVSFGLDKSGNLGLGENIKVEKAGLYDIILTYVPKAGSLSASFTYETKLTKESNVPTELYMIGQDFGNWDWASESVVTMLPAHSEPGTFWAIRYITAANGFKFAPAKEWGKDFCGQTTNEGFTQKDGNCFVAADGLYMIEVDLVNSVINIHPAEVFGMGDAFGNWDEGKNPYKVSADGKTVSIAATAAGNMRTYAGSKFDAAKGNWWHREFIVKDGKIVYRAAGGDPEAVALTAGQTITLDFNAGTGSIK